MSQTFQSNFKPVVKGTAVVTEFGGARVKLMTDDDVYAEIRTYMSKMNATELESLLQTFKNTINSLLSFATEKVSGDEEDCANLERVRRIIGFLPPEEIFIRVKDKVWAVRDHIINENLQYFMDKDYGNMIKKDQKQELLENIICVIKDYVTQMSEEDIQTLWTKGKIMLRCVALYERMRRAIEQQSI